LIIQKKLPIFVTRKIEDLIVKYNKALQEANDLFLDKETAALLSAEAEIYKILMFFSFLKFPEPTFEEIKEFCTVYEEAYKRNDSHQREYRDSN
jgi:hypothetical protein